MFRASHACIKAHYSKEQFLILIIFPVAHAANHFVYFKWLLWLQYSDTLFVTFFFYFFLLYWDFFSFLFFMYLNSVSSFCSFVKLSDPFICSWHRLIAGDSFAYWDRSPRISLLMYLYAKRIYFFNALSLQDVGNHDLLWIPLLYCLWITWLRESPLLSCEIYWKWFSWRSPRFWI